MIFVIATSDYGLPYEIFSTKIADALLYTHYKISLASHDFLTIDLSF
jgi:hypothetical protein